MKSAKLKINKRSIVLFPLVFLFILMSGSAVGLAYSSIIDPLFLMVSLGYFLLTKNYKSISQGQIITALILITCYVLNYLIFFEDGAYRNAYVSYTMRIVSCFFFCCSIDKEEFEEMFIYVMVAVASYSLIFFFISQTLGLISGVNTSWRYPIHFLYNYNGYLLHRNSGIFWEPGAYQLFLNVALLFNLNKSKFNIRNILNMPNVLFVISIVTTKSTTGYFAFGIIVIFLIFKCWNDLSKKEKIVLLLPLIAFFVVFGYLIMTSDTVVDKFYGNGRSYSIRQNDFWSSIEPIKSHFLFGYGIGTNQYQAMASYNDISSNSVGVFITAIYFGVFYTGFYSYRMIKNVVTTQKEIIIPFLMVLLLSMFTEDFFRYAIYFVLAIGFGDKSYEKKHQKTNL